MEANPLYVAAIDVGTTKIVSLLGKRNENNKLEVVGHERSESKGIRRGEVLNPEEAANVVSKTVFELQRRTGIVFTEVFVGIAGLHIRIVKSRNYINRASYDDCITQDDIEQLRRDANNIALDEGKEIIHLLAQSFIVDNETDIHSPIGMLGKRLEANFNIVVSNSDSIKRIRKCIQKAGLNICGEVILEPLASAKSVLYDEEREAGVALVDIGGGTTDIAVFYDKTVRHSAVIPFGGFVVTKDIKKELGLSEQVAEEVKLQFGVALSDAAEENKYIVIRPTIPGREPKEISLRNLAHIIQARMEEIIEGVMFEIENSGCADKLGCGIVITGGGAMLKHLKELFRFRTGLDVRIGYPGEHLAGESESVNDPSYATGVGLLMMGFDFLDEHPEMLTEVRYFDKTNESKTKKTPDPVPEPKPEEQEEPAEEAVAEGEKTSILSRWFSFDGIKESVIRSFEAAEPKSRMEY